MAEGSVAFFDMTDVRAGIAQQAAHVGANGAPITQRICLAQLAVLESDTACGARMRGWPGRVLEDALPLRLAGGLHWLHLVGAEQRLGPVYAGDVTDQPAVDALVMAVVEAHDATLLGWFDSPPQTNEAGRSASFMAGLAWLAQRVGTAFELNEIGASAGINTMMDRYFYDLGGQHYGPASSPMRITPEWRGPPPPAVQPRIVSIQGCDQSPINLADAAQALRVKSYIWPENLDRLARMDAAIRLAGQKPPCLVAMDATDWVEQRLATPQAEGVCRVINHSIVWQYIPEAGRARMIAAMEAAGRHATQSRPVAWLSLETNRATFRHELTVRFWPGGGKPLLLGEAQAHGTWVEWLGVE